MGCMETPSVLATTEQALRHSVGPLDRQPGRRSQPATVADRHHVRGQHAQESVDVPGPDRSQEPLDHLPPAPRG